jgi:hypothetical protein
VQVVGKFRGRLGFHGHGHWFLGRRRCRG